MGMKPTNNSGKSGRGGQASHKRIPELSERRNFWRRVIQTDLDFPQLHIAG